jgi:CspA family cold shock protein
MPTGTVKFFDERKGFGFIIPDDAADQDVFVHATALDDSNIDVLIPGMAVSYDIGVNSRNRRPKAINLKVLTA